MDSGNASSFIGLIFYIAAIVVYVTAFWKIFTKAGKPGWASLIPIYNAYVMLQIVGRPGWWILLFLVPLVNLIISLIVSIDLAKSYGKSTAFGVLLLWLFSFIGYLILGFDKSKYVGPSAKSSQQGVNQQPQMAQQSEPAAQPIQTPQQPPTNTNQN